MHTFIKGSKADFKPTHQHADGGMYQMVDHGKVKMGADWEDGVFYRASDGTWCVTSLLRWNARFVPVDQRPTPAVRKSFAEWLREKISYHRPGFTAEDTQIAERVIIALSTQAGPTDKRRLDWLESMRVEVRLPLVHGSRALFHASPEQGDGEEKPSTIRGQVDYWIMHSADKKGTS